MVAAAETATVAAAEMNADGGSEEERLPLLLSPALTERREPRFFLPDCSESSVGVAAAVFAGQ